ncbi:hypothetical protein [Hymenobacter sp. YC55]|nr:hypothetical protein [Hymenobacter sp. YC55]MDF7810060.1 hypothetical protein [Hymenobacter sp. YC55]
MYEEKKVRTCVARVLADYTHPDVQVVFRLHLSLQAAKRQLDN